MIVLPMLTPGMEHGLLAKWRVKPGDAVRVGDIIAEIETDKATIEMEAVVDGVLDEICVAEGTPDVKVNTVLARMQGDAPATRPANSVAVSPAAAAAPAVRSANGRSRLFASPVARRMARAAKIDLSSMTGSGPRGRITKRDVESVLASGSDRSLTAVDVASAAAGASVMLDGPQTLIDAGMLPGSYDLVPLDSMRKVIARRMTDSFRDVPHFPLNIDVHVGELLELRSRINALTARAGIKVSVNDMIVKAAATALMRVPSANASYTSEGIAMHRHADIAVAVAVEGGLITPIIRAAETKSLSFIAREMSELSQQARGKRLKPEQFRGGTFSVSNLGMFGIRSFASILNPPQGCIMSVGAAEERVVPRDAVASIAWVMSVTLTCDHRVVDGAIGARFLAAFRELIESPVALLVQ
jgi:pyruvate dehydrogenase E2 component (dihydrolipoamide acetyltransferase)